MSHGAVSITVYTIHLGTVSVQLYGAFNKTCSTMKLEPSCDDDIEVCSHARSADVLHAFC